MIYKKIEIKVDGYKETADLYTYFLDNSIEMNINRKRPVVVICPGGGYTMTSDREAEPIAMQYLAKGYHAVILRYSVEPARYPLALLQLAKSVAFLRENAAEFHIDTNKIVIQGFSAGGHLAASLGVFWKKNFIAETLGIDSEMVKPNGMILSYPVITSGEFAHTGSFECLLGEDYNDLDKRKEQSLEFQVSRDTPPTFLWHTVTDDCVPVENSLLFFNALRKLEIPVEMHLYPVGGHGLSLANEETSYEDGGCVQKAIDTAVSNAQQKWQALTDDRLSEAEKLAKMNKEEKAAYMQQKKEKELSDREAVITRKELMTEAKNTLVEKKLPVSLAEVLNYADADTCNKSISAVEKAFQEAVEAAVNERLKGGTPPKKAPQENVTKETYAKMGYTERLKLKTENPELYKQLAGK